MKTMTYSFGYVRYYSDDSNTSFVYRDRNQYSHLSARTLLDDAKIMICNIDQTKHSLFNVLAMHRLVDMCMNIEPELLIQSYQLREMKKECDLYAQKMRESCE